MGKKSTSSKNAKPKKVSKQELQRAYAQANRDPGQIDGLKNWLLTNLKFDS